MRACPRYARARAHATAAAHSARRTSQRDTLPPSPPACQARRAECPRQRSQEAQRPQARLARLEGGVEVHSTLICHAGVTARRGDAGRRACKRRKRRWTRAWPARAHRMRPVPSPRAHASAVRRARGQCAHASACAGAHRHRHDARSPPCRLAAQRSPEIQRPEARLALSEGGGEVHGTRIVHAGVTARRGDAGDGARQRRRRRHLCVQVLHAACSPSCLTARAHTAPRRVPMPALT